MHIQIDLHVHYSKDIQLTLSDKQYITHLERRLMQQLDDELRIIVGMDKDKSKKEVIMNEW